MMKAILDVSPLVSDQNNSIKQDLGVQEVLGGRLREGHS